MPFVAVELREGEHHEDVIRLFITVAADLGVSFRKLKTYGPLEFARHSFVRFQTDCPSFPAIIARMKVEGRSIIAPSTTGYRVFLSNGKEGPVGSTPMLEIARPGYGKVYLGPSHEHWRAQFTQAGAPATPEEGRGGGDDEA